ncbi:hypothetical protein K505DRAFT_368562 [Melanomma pulvis-pyrius CBS 109.77]|uniref:Uncharacterized protein n=1 Tax=Melanomma pulvis-pyrius CBS 109.77 TaxID=1314802 RepID=A0A6A6WQ53_9PLEO|nr:hypothetical protein K505DRAFT_368562 [Melanomma pulvis-pyrius CBS 109.77]
MSTRYVSSQLIKNVQPSGSPSAQLKNTFSEVVEQNMSSFSARTAKVAMKESEHQSNVDNRMHYTAYELDSNGNVIQTRHIVQQVQK